MHGGFGPKIGIRKGDLIAGKYRIDGVLGTGSTGVVLAAYHLKLHERVAIKLLLPEALANPEAVQRFEREARAAVKIKSEHVVRIIDVGALDEGAPYIVMEHLQGEDLAERLTRTGPLPFEEAVDFMMQACEAIAEAHGLGIIHRDLKPANLFCVHGNDGQTTIKVLDFGISKVLDGGALHTVGEATKTSIVVGSPFYMSPEQMQAPRTVDVRTDIWAIGVILHELLTGAVPFGGETLPQIAVHVAKNPPPSLRLSRSDVPPVLEGVILRCLEKNAKKRYNTVAELAAALGRFGPKKALSSVDRIRLAFKNGSERPFAVSLLPEGEVAEQAAAGTSPSSWGAATTRQIDVRSRRNLAAMIATGFLLAGGGVWWIKSAPRSDMANAPALGSQPLRTDPKSELAVPAAEDPTRAYPVTPGATVIAVPPPTGTGAAPLLPKGRANEPRHAKPGGVHASVEPEADNAAPGMPSQPAASPSRAAPTKGEGTCLLNLANLTGAQGSNVFLDGNALGSNAKIATSVWAGTHSVVFRTADGQTRKTTATCAPGDTKNIDARSLGATPAEGARGTAPDPCPLCERP
jgi:serine/threonine protein kinase